jgi:hypothetical protein
MRNQYPLQHSALTRQELTRQELMNWSLTQRALAS